MDESTRPSEGLTLPCAARSLVGGAFAPTLAAAQAHVAAVQPAACARTRNVSMPDGYENVLYLVGQQP